MATAGPNSGGTFADDATVGAVLWVNPGNAIASDDVRATSALGAGQATHYLKATNFGFSIPTNATIQGVLVEVERSSATGLGIVVDNSVKLVKGGTIQGDEKATVVDWGVTDVIDPHGGSSDLWGLALTPADINASTFGCVVSGGEGGDGARTARIDHIKITVTYSLGNMKRRPSMAMAGFGS